MQQGGVQPKRMGWEALKAAYGLNSTMEGWWFNTPPYLVWGETRQPDDPCEGLQAVVYPGSVTLPDWRAQDAARAAPAGQACACLVVEGDLTLEGDLDLTMSDCGTPLYVLVLGTLRARNVFVREQGELMVGGDMLLSGTLLASRWANGQVHVKGRLQAAHAYLDGFLVKVRGALDATTFVFGDSSLLRTSEPPVRPVRWLIDWDIEDFDGADELDTLDGPEALAHRIVLPCLDEDVPAHGSSDDKIMHFCRQGVPVFRVRD